MNRHGPRVLVGWGIGNGALLAIIAGYGGNGFALGLPASAVTITLSMGLIMLISTFRHPLPMQRRRVSTRGEVGMAVAAFLFMIGLSGVFGVWFDFPAIPLLVLSIWLASRRPSRAAP